jgi:hypothetical protein
MLHGDRGYNVTNTLCLRHSYYIGTPFNTTFKSKEALISSARAFSSSTFQFTQANFPLRNSASGEASQTRK